MKIIAYYISDYGFGHASRSIAIIRELFTQYNGDLQVIVCNSYAMSFLKDSLCGLNVVYREVSTDVGYVLKLDTLEIDKFALRKKYLDFIQDWHLKLLEERNFLVSHEVDLVISDISPLPFVPAKDLGIPSVGVSNFTWYTAYQNLLDESLLITFKQSYESMGVFLALEGHKEPAWTNTVKTYGFIARTIDHAAVTAIKRELNPNREKILVFLGLGMKINVNMMNFKLWNNSQCIFIVSANTDIAHPNVFKIPENVTESQNYIAAADLVISKAGWGTVSEALIYNSPLVILNRDYMTEDKNTIDYLKSINKVQLIDWKDFEEFNVDSVMTRKLNALSSKEVLNEIEIVTADLLKQIN